MNRKVALSWRVIALLMGIGACAGRAALHAQRAGLEKMSPAIAASVDLGKFSYSGMLGTSKISMWLYGVTVLPGGELWLSAGSAVRVIAPQQAPVGSYLARFELYTTNPTVPVQASIGTVRTALTPCVMQPSPGEASWYMQSCEVSFAVTSGALEVWLELSGPSALSSVVEKVTVSRFRELMKAP
jgi:hypothetical protein